MRFVVGTVAAAINLGILLAACLGTGYEAVPYTIADAEPLPTACPTYVPGCERPPSTYHTATPDPDPTSTATAGGTPRPGRTPTAGPRTGATPSPGSSPTTPGGGGGIKPPPGEFVAFTFDSIPFAQAFPLDPPPPPDPRVRPLPTPLVLAAAALAAGIAAAAGTTSRRRWRRPV